MTTTNENQKNGSTPDNAGLEDNRLTDENVALKIAELKRTAKGKALFEIKIGRDWVMVTASSMAVISQYCKDIGNVDWRKVGMLPMSELIKAHDKCEFIG